MKKPIALMLLVLAAPAVARAGNVSMVVRDVPLGPRTVQSAAAPTTFNMLGVHWQGAGTVAYRTRAPDGRWRAWRDVDDDARPDRGSRERSRTWRDGNLDWAGASNGVQFRTRGAVSRLRAYYLWSRVSHTLSRRLSLAGSPAIVPRSGWFADEKILRAKPIYAPTLRLAVVHHTAGTNVYSAAQAAAIVRGIEVYHVKGNGWNDIGYNFLIDRYGVVYEGRGGGIDRNVVGAHAEGFNTGTVGVALIGNYSNAQPTSAQRAALVKLLAWRLDVAHVDPLSTVVYTSGGNAKWKAGKAVTLRAISGHRDTGPSECPGAGASALLPALAAQVAVTGLPKLYAPVVSGALGGPLRFQARFSSALPWTISVADARGTVVARATGTGRLVDWTWDATRASRTGSYTWTIDGGASVLPARGTLGKASGAPPPAPALLSGLAVMPGVVTPNADGTGDVAAVRFTLAATASVTIQVLDANGVSVLTLDNAPRPAGANEFDWGAHVLGDGRYKVVVTATPASGRAVSQSADLVVDRTLTGFASTSPLLSPNGDGLLDAVTFTFGLALSVPVRLEIRQGAAILTMPFSGQLAAGPHVLSWDGTANGVRVPDGSYDAAVVVSDGLGDVSLVVPLTVDTTPPVVTVVNATKRQFRLSEPATVTVSVNGVQRPPAAYPAGVFTVPFTGQVTSIQVQAQDGAGNLSTIVRIP